MTDTTMFDKMNGADLRAAFISAPAIIAWIGYWLAILLAPHLATEPVPIMWAFYAGGGWLALMGALAFGWFLAGGID